MERVERSLLRNLEASARLLAGPAAPDDEAVHLARKRLKDSRAALRLMRPVLGTPRSMREESALRRAARRLSVLRDERVVADLLARLRAPAAPPLRPRPSPPPDWRRSGAEIQACRRRLAAAFPRELTPEEAREGLKRSRRQARRRLRTALNSGTGEDRHALRKSAKRLRAQLILLRPASRLIPGLARLSRLLGDERDLSLLLHTLSRRGTRLPWASAVAERAERRRARLARSSLELARRLL